jgi:hypothetical protein
MSGLKVPTGRRKIAAVRLLATATGPFSPRTLLLGHLAIASVPRDRNKQSNVLHVLCAGWQGTALLFAAIALRHRNDHLGF